MKFNNFICHIECSLLLTHLDHSKTDAQTEREGTNDEDKGENEDNFRAQSLGGGWRFVVHYFFSISIMMTFYVSHGIHLAMPRINDEYLLAAEANLK